MPTLTNIVLPEPKSWDEFEDICLSALKIKWSSSNLTKHGRQGQKQDGVDIYGDDDLGRFVGVQCKQTLTKISEKIITAEILKAESFKPEIKALYIATTAPSDVHLQKTVRILSQDRVTQKLFPVGIFFWNDIVQDLSKNQDELLRFYPQFFSFQHEEIEKTPDSLLNKNDYFSLSRKYNLPCRCPLFQKCERRIQTLDLINQVFNGQAIAPNTLTSIVSSIGEPPYFIGGDTSFMINKVCPEVSLFEAPVTIMSILKAPFINAEYDKYIEPQYKIIETGHFAECAEYVSYNL